jgi:hypothetical protein
LPAAVYVAIGAERSGRSDVIRLCDGGPAARLKILYKVLAGVAVVVALIAFAPELSRLG